MTNERSRGRLFKPSRTWQSEIQVGVRLRLDLDSVALLTIFLHQGDVGTLIRDALFEYAKNHGLDSTKKGTQDAILEKALSFERLGLPMSTHDYLTGKTPEEKLEETRSLAKSTDSTAEIPRSRNKKTVAADGVTPARSNPLPKNAQLTSNIHSIEARTPKQKLDLEKIANAFQVKEPAPPDTSGNPPSNESENFALTLLKRYSDDDDY